MYRRMTPWLSCWESGVEETYWRGVTFPKWVLHPQLSYNGWSLQH